MNIRKNINKYLVLLIIIYMFLNVLVVNASSKDELIKSIIDIKTELYSEKTKLREIEDDISFQFEKVEVMKHTLEKTRKEVEAIEKEVKLKDKVLKKRLKAMYMSGGKQNWLFLLMTSKDLNEVLSRYEMMKIIVEHDKKLLESLRGFDSILEKKEKELEEIENETSLNIKELEKREKLLTEKIDEVNNELVKLENKLAIIIKEEEEELKRQAEIRKHNELVALERRNYNLNLLENIHFTNGYAWPIPTGDRISSYFGSRMHPILKVNKFHTGVDIPAKEGDPVISAIDGIVILSDWFDSYGKTIIISNGNMTTLYAHNSDLIVNEGDYVNAGDLISLVGSTGRSTGPHLHFEVKKGGKLINPLDLYK